MRGDRRAAHGQAEGLGETPHGQIDLVVAQVLHFLRNAAVFVAQHDGKLAQRRRRRRERQERQQGQQQHGFDIISRRELKQQLQLQQRQHQCS